MSVNSVAVSPNGRLLIAAGMEMRPETRAGPVALPIGRSPPGSQWHEASSGCAAEMQHTVKIHSRD